MDILHVRSVPEDLYRRLKAIAIQNNRSLSAQVIELLSRAVESEEQRQQQEMLLTSIRRRRFIPPVEAPSSLALLREDRDR